MVKPITIRIILTLFISYKWEIQPVGVNNAFLNGDLKEEVYMQQPPGFLDGRHLSMQAQEGNLWIEQTPHAWYETPSLIDSVWLCFETI